MHIWHHSKALPEEHPNGMNYGLTLSIWDYLFGTAYVPHDGKDIELGFEGDEDFPETFTGQMKFPFRREKDLFKKEDILRKEKSDLIFRERK